MKYVLVALLAAGCSHRASEQSYDEVRRDDLVIGVEVTGTLAAVDSTDVKPPPLADVWNFKIANLAAEGDEVKVGDPVIAFDPSEQVRALESMKNESDAAQKKLEKKQQDAALARRDDELKVAEAEAAYRKAQLKAQRPPELIASVDLKTLQLEEQNAKLVLEGANNHAAQSKRSDQQELAQLTDKASYAKHRAEVLQKNIESMQVVASRAGTIVYPINWQGEKHKVGDSVWRMEDIMSIVGLGTMVGDGVVDEVDVARVAAGQPVTLRLDALPDVQLSGTVKDIAKSVEAASNTDPSKVVKLRLTIAKTKVPLRPGMRFRGQVQTEKIAHAIVVPVEAVFVKPDGPVAYRLRGNDVERVKLQLGKRSATAIEVVKGLEPGDRVARTEPSS